MEGVTGDVEIYLADTDVYKKRGKEMSEVNIEGKVWEAIQQYKQTPSDKTAQKVISSYTVYEMTKPSRDQKYELLNRYYKVICNHNKYRSDGI